MATHSRVLAWRIPGPGEPGGLPSMGSHRVGHDWSDLAATAAAETCSKNELHPLNRRENWGSERSVALHHKDWSKFWAGFLVKISLIHVFSKYFFSLINQTLGIWQWPRNRHNLWALKVSNLSGKAKHITNYTSLFNYKGFPAGSAVKNQPAMQET